MRSPTTYMPLATALALAMSSSACMSSSTWTLRDDNGWPMTTWEARERLGCGDAARAARTSPDSASPRTLRLAELCGGRRVAYEVTEPPTVPPPTSPAPPPPVPRPTAVSTEQPSVGRLAP